MKECTNCHETKPLTEYYKSVRMKSGYASGCKKCCDAAHTKSRNKKRVHYRTVQRDREYRNADRLLSWKAEQKCKCCSETDPVCLDLHHLDSKEKDVNIADVSRFWSWQRLTQEIEKCIVLCANCHRKVHAGTLNIGY